EASHAQVLAEIQTLLDDELLFVDRDQDRVVLLDRRLACLDDLIHWHVLDVNLFPRGLDLDAVRLLGDLCTDDDFADLTPLFVSDELLLEEPKRVAVSVLTSHLRIAVMKAHRARSFSRGGTRAAIRAVEPTTRLMRRISSAATTFLSTRTSSTRTGSRT